ncbi:TIGR00341 family protein [Haloarcula salinisoli]|uniref:TIGR00341 family protein n=1 Tax=Haloarcula salinisoli TaxID=2487746 RepID=A0A8J7YIA0_9EURY|nr:TIGR00341 family protein [Halomicroarcula salinisoli]MBX0286121.1 TIGR00341 family protein [Halomicroarcula salinisoli]MBX0302391.1 TIGR00341 family protein [Halomicroarcula salinisoli]
MRLVQVVVPDEKREAIVSALRERELGVSTTTETSGEDDRTLVSFVVPADAVEAVLEELHEVGFEDEWYIVSIETEFASYENVDEVQDRWAKTPNRVAPRTLRSKGKDMRLNTRSYLWMMTLSTVIATAGLLVGSPAIVVGSMVLAPIVSPMLTASIGLVRDDQRMVFDSIRMQGVGLGLAVVGATAFSLLLKYLFAVPAELAVANIELIAIRFSPSILSVVVGLAAGAAGSFSLATKGQVTIVGVMVAAALIPTAAAAGIGFAWDRPVVGAGSTVLLVMTIVAVNLGAFLTFKYLGYEPDEVDRGVFTTTRLKDTVTLGVTVLLVVAVMGAVAVGTYQQVTYERSVNKAATEVLQRDAYEALGVVSITAEYVGIGPFLEPSTVTVALSRTGDQSYSRLPDELAQAIGNRTDERVRVQVRFQDYQRSNVSASPAGPPTTAQMAVQRPTADRPPTRATRHGFRRRDATPGYD